MPLLLRRLAILLFIATLAGSPLAAQRALSGDASIGLSSGSQRHAVSAWLPVASLWDRLRLDAGLRATSYGSDAGIYTNRGTITAACPNTISIATGVIGVNVAMQASVRLVGPVSAGFNLDFAGFATGTSRSSGSLAASVQAGSLFLGGSPDVGARISETCVAVQVTDRVTLRAGTSHYVTNYSVTDPATPGSASVRYQKFVTVPFVALAFRF